MLMRNRISILALALTVVLAGPVGPLAAPAAAQSATTSRDVMRDRLIALLAQVGKRSDVNIDFHQSDKNPYSVTGFLRTGLKNEDGLEVVWSVSKSDTIAMRAYPHYNGSYINLDKVRDYPGFMRTLLKLNDTNFMYWGADNTNDVFVAYEFTLESGFPTEAITVVARSIPNQDQFVGQLRPFVDGTHGS
jgi:hypothetical protein